MKYSKRSRLACAIGAALALVLGARSVAAQTLTTGIISGVVADQQGAVLPGVTVAAVHEPTGTRYEAVAGGDGRFQIPNVRVGGPYTVTATLSGFKDQTQSNLNVGLGEDKSVEFKLSLATLTETITVTAESPVIDTARAGTAANVKQEVIESIPTIARSITDVASTSPYFNQQNSNGGDSFLSVAGRNNRYNNIQIDGAVNNDLFGLAASGTPGGQTGTQPISYDAIQEIQLVVSPYDVRQGGFSGGSINLVTRSGSNSLNGSTFFYSRNQSLVGAIDDTCQRTAVGGACSLTSGSVLETKVGRFSDRQGGFSLGGPIVQNKAFFFGNLDLQRKQTPNGFSVSGTSGQPYGHQDEVNQIVAIAQRYGYDAGGLDEFSKATKSDKVFVRADFNISPKHQLMVRNNYVDGSANQSGTTPSNLIYIMPGNFYTITDTLTSSVGELNSTWARAFNQLRVTYQRERNQRDPGAAFPHIQVDLTCTGCNVRLGSELSSQANKLNQDIVEINDDVTLIRGAHTFTLGTHNELFKFMNVFVQNFFGQYRFSSIENFAAGIAQGFNHNFSNDASSPLNPAEFSVRQYGFYAGDQWRAKSNLTLTYGFRFDMPNFPDKPHANPLAASAFGYATDVTPAPKMFSPRIGFNWDLSNGGAKRSQVRGGLGLFAGRTPYVWLSNQYSNTGVDFTALAVTFNAANRVTFVADPNNQPNSVPGGIAGNQTINVVDPDYLYPEVFRGNLAYDHELGVFGLIGTGEVLFSSNVRDIAYQNLNYVQTGTRVDGRPSYAKKLATVNDVILLTNSDQGGQWSVSYKVDRPFKSGFFFSGSYLYGQAKSVIDGNSSVATSNFFGLYQAGDINNPPLAISDFDIRHRVSFTSTIPVPLWRDLRSYASFYYNGQSGRPYSIVFNNDVNLDSRTTNDLIFVPASPDQVLVTGGTWDQLDAFLSNDDAVKNYRGQIAPRNTGRAPWTNSLNFRYAVNIPTGGRTKVDVSMDVFNFLNLLNSDNGWVWYPNFGGPTIIGATVGADGKYTYNLNTIAGANFLGQTQTTGVPGTFTRDDLRSRWQMQWGARVRF
jgi:hypothetical protein